MMFLNCPACLDQEGALRCGLPAEVRYRFNMRSSDGPLESAMISCPVGHDFSGPIESFTRDSTDKHDPGPAVAGARAGRDSLRAGGGGSALRGIPHAPERKFAARTALPPTIWAILRACGSPSCARTAGVAHPITWCKPSPAEGRRYPGTAALVAAARPKPPARRPPPRPRWLRIWPTIRELISAHHGTNDEPRTQASARDTMWLARTVHDQWPWRDQ